MGQIIIGWWVVVTEWLKDHESLAIWLEGIALVAIFTWDRIDSKSQHQETLAHIKIATEQAETARLTAQSVVNSERAWLTTSLRWRQIGNIVTLTSQVGDQQIINTCIEFWLTI